MSTKISGNTYLAEVDSSNNLYVRLPGVSSSGSNIGGGNSNAPAIFSEVDSGEITNSRLVVSPEADVDYRLRSALDIVLEDEIFNYAAQNTGKYSYTNTTMTITWGASGMTTNASSIVTTTIGVYFKSYSTFPVSGNGQVLYFQQSCAISNQPTSNSSIDFGLYLTSGANPYLPTDGVYFRIDSAGVKAVINNNTTESETLLDFTYSNNEVYKFVIAVSQSQVLFFINDTLYANISTPIGQGAPIASASLPIGIRQANVGAAGAIIQMLVKNISVSLGGNVFAEQLGSRGNAIYGSYQGLSGGTMGSLSTYTNSTNPSAAVPSNTVVSSGLPSALGGQCWETFTLAVNTDGILMSYQVPAASVTTTGKRLKVTGVKLSSFVQAALTGGPMNRTFCLNFGHTAVSLANTESATGKARRVVLLPELTQTITANQAINTMIAQVSPVALFQEPIYVNPGEFISISVKHIGTVGTLGTIATNIQFIYSWE